MNAFKKVLYKLGLLHESHSKSVHVAAYITDGSLLIMFALIPLVIIDEYLLSNALHEYLSLVGKVSLGAFGVGCVLIILATNKII